MDEQRLERAGGAESAEVKAGSTAPTVDKLIAGGAEAGPAADVEGLDGLS